MISERTIQRLTRFAQSSQYRQLAPETQKRLQGFLQQEQTGKIQVTPSPFRQAIAETKRAGAAVTKGLLGDVPFLRQALPQQIRQFKPHTFEEKALVGVPRMGRDIAMMSGIKGLGLARTALRGAGIGMATAGTEKPTGILGAGARGAVTLPIIKKAGEMIAPAVSRIVQKGIKTTQQAWQDLIRAGFMVEKSTVEKVQQKGLQSFFTKNINPKLGLSNRHEDAYWRLGNKMFDSTMRLRRFWGNKVGRWRNMLFKDPRIKVSTVNARNNFQVELKKPETGILTMTGEPIRPIQVGTDTAGNRLLEINNLLSSGNVTTPQFTYQIIDKLDDLVSASKRGAFSLAKNEGRIIVNLRRDLINQITKSAPRNIAKGLRATETKFAEVAEVTDDMFQQLPVRQEGVALKELKGATERNLSKGLKKDTPFEIKEIYQKLEKLLPKQDKFLDLYKEVFAAQDLQREGMGMFLRRLVLSPRMAGFGMQVMQPLTRGTGQVLGATGQAARGLLPPHLMRRAIQRR